MLSGSNRCNQGGTADINDSSLTESKLCQGLFYVLNLYYDTTSNGEQKGGKDYDSGNNYEDRRQAGSDLR